MNAPGLYISLKNEHKTDKEAVYLTDICSVWDFKKHAFIDTGIVYELKSETTVIDLMDVIAMISIRLPDCEIKGAFGSKCVINKTKPVCKAFIFIKILLFCAILFFGGAIGIISFNEDVEMRRVHSDINGFFTRETSESAPFVSIPYSIGILFGFIGILGIFKRKGEKKPGLLELDIMEYEQKINNYLKDRKR